MDASRRIRGVEWNWARRRKERTAAMTVTAREPLVAYCSELASPRDRDKRPASIEYAEQTLRALTILARRYDPTGDRKKANPVWLNADSVERAAALQEALTAWEREETPPAQT